MPRLSNDDLRKPRHRVSAIHAATASDPCFASESLQEETHRLESLYQRKLAALEELKKSLLHRAFSGEL